jgi:hypothetical protein
VERTLQLTFRNEEGRRQTLTLADPRDNLTANEVEEVMNLILQKNIFSGSGGDLIEALAAQVIGRTVEVIYTA